MITTAEPPRKRSVFVFALAISIALHLLLGIFGLRTERLLALLHVPPKEKKTDMVAMSTITIEHRPKAVPRPHAPAAPPAQPRIVPRPQVLPVPPQDALPRVLAQRPAVSPSPVPTATEEPTTAPVHKREIATIRPSAPPEASPVPTPLHGSGKLTRNARLPEETKIAYVKPPVHTDTTNGRGTTQLSQAQIAQMEQKFAQSIAAQRSSTNPLSVPTDPPAATKKYRIDVPGLQAALAGGQGTLWQTASPFTRNGVNYYYVAFDLQASNGFYDTGPVPWPIGFPSKHDPFGSGGRYHGPMPCPADDYVLPASARASLRPTLWIELNRCNPEKYPLPDEVKKLFEQPQ